MKITLKLTYDEIVVINNGWRYIPEIQSTSGLQKDNKLMLSIFMDLAKKFQKKAIEKADAIKSFKMSLSYCEAYFLEKYLIQIRLMDDYSVNVQRRIIAQINQKLA